MTVEERRDYCCDRDPRSKMGGEAVDWVRRSEWCHLGLAVGSDVPSGAL